MSTEQEVYERKISQFEKKYGVSEFSDIIRFTNDRVENVDRKNQEYMKQFDDNMILFSQQTVTEFKKLWSKLKEIEARVPGPVVKPVEPPAKPAEPAQPAQPAQPAKPAEPPKPPAAATKAK